MKRFLSFILPLIITLALSAVAYGQAIISFSGGNGTPLTLTLLESVSYTVTTSSSSEAPLFDFENLNFLASYSGASSDSLTFSIDGGAPISANELAPGGGDTYAFNTGFPGVTAGQVVTLNAGSFTVSGDFADAAPAGGSFYTYITDSSGNSISTGGLAVPEPSTWALFLLGGLGAFLFARRSRCA